MQSVILTVSLNKSQLDEVDSIPHTFTANVFTVQIAKVGQYTLKNFILYFWYFKYY